MFTINADDKTYQLLEVEYWGQRVFGKAKDLLTSETFLFISSKGFDRFYRKAEAGISARFHSTRSFNPYLCIKEKDIYRESLLLERGESISDIGPGIYTGFYQFWFDTGTFYDSIYFETYRFKIEGFDLFQYQTDDLYYVSHQSSVKDRLPRLFGVSNADFYNNVNIIHGVHEDGREYFDVQSVNDLILTDACFDSDNPIYNILRAAKSKTIFKTKRIGAFDFINFNILKELKEDCGHEYILGEGKTNKKKRHALRGLYEYFRFVANIVNDRRKKSVSTPRGPREFKNEEFLPIFYGSSSRDFKLVYFKNVITLERKHILSPVVSGDPEFSVNGFFDYLSGSAAFDEFNSKAELAAFVKKHFGVNTSLKLSSLISTWFPETLGYQPKRTILPMCKKANSAPIVDSIQLYSIPTYDDSHEVILSDDTYVNLYELLGCFGLHIHKIRNILRMNEFPSQIFQDLRYTFPIYHISRDTRRNIFNWDNDATIKSTMVHISTALKLIELFCEIGDNKNIYWYSNANKLIQAFPDCSSSGDEISSMYMPSSLKNYVENA